ncbi:MAG: nitroreductase family protein [Phycisphaerales bacterium]
MNVGQIDPRKHRSADHDILPVFVQRWSPRAMTGGVSRPDLMRLLEAARWSPSSYNEQPWRFLYAMAGTPEFAKFLACLMDANQVWARNAGVLMLLVTSKNFTRNGKPNGVAVFDAGAAWQSLALQGAAMGLAVHAMAGFDAGKAAADLKVPDDFHCCAMIAVGKPGEIESLPADYQKIEAPSGRNAIAEFAFEGGWR